MPMLNGRIIWCATRPELLDCIPSAAISEDLERVTCGSCSWSQFIRRAALPANGYQDAASVRSMRRFHVNCGMCAYCCACCYTCGHATEAASRCNNEEPGYYICADCCSCVSCSSCAVDRRDSEICDHCRICLSCCECLICRNCASVVECDDDDDDDCGFCDNCESCAGCCSCRPGGGVRWLSPPAETVFHAASALSERKQNRSMRAVACEIEVAGSTLRKGAKNLTAVLRRWHGAIVHDGSLPSRGFEINTAPAAGDFLLKQLKEICDVLAFNEAHASSDCGLHVHVDTRDFSGFDLRRLAMIYYLVENGIFALQPSSRASSSYANHCGSHLLTRGLLNASSEAEAGKHLICSVYDLDIGYWRDYASLARQKYVDSRYNALNLHSHWHRGSVEFRHGAGSVSYNYISKWALLCLRVAEAAKKYSDALVLKKAALAYGVPSLRLPDLRDLPESNNEAAIKMLRMVAGRKLEPFIDYRLSHKHSYTSVSV